MATKFLVDAAHIAPEYRLAGAIVTVQQDRLDGTWYWSMSPFGCSKSYGSPKDAIVGMLSDHGCYDIKATQITD